VFPLILVAVVTIPFSVFVLLSSVQKSSGCSGEEEDKMYSCTTLPSKERKREKQRGSEEIGDW
jgi:hypothetical protein